MKRLFIILLFTLTYASISGQCNYPTHVSADSLVNYVIAECKYKAGVKTLGISDSTWKRNFYDNTIGIKYDTAFQKCQEYLIARLGKELYCKYIDMFPNSFGLSKNKDQVQLIFGFQLPNLIHEQHIGYINCKYERVLFNFKMHLLPDSSLEITYPKNIPHCNGLPNCGFVITKDSAISIAKKNNFLTERQQYRIEPDGINWVIDADANTIRVNLQTGKATIQRGYRID